MATKLNTTTTESDPAQPNFDAWLTRVTNEAKHYHLAALHRAKLADGAVEHGKFARIAQAIADFKHAVQ
jgi:hypothetical protein